jgi:UDP-GlcNAc3NAcA epimerase
VMYDNSLHFSHIASTNTTLIKELGLESKQFILATIHRNNNTDEPARLTSLFVALNTLSKQHDLTVVLPLHPRTAKLLEQNLPPEVYNEIKANGQMIILPPASFLEMVALEKNATMVVTDSGGVQKEAFYFKKPCIILRSETEWVELVDCGAAIIADADTNRILAAYDTLTKKKDLKFPALFGDGMAAEFICTEILKYIQPHAARIHT